MSIKKLNGHNSSKIKKSKLVRNREEKKIEQIPVNYRSNRY